MLARGRVRRPALIWARQLLFLFATLLVTPRDACAAPSAGEAGIASWYGPGFQGKRTASGELYDKEKLTAAHRTLPFGTYLRVRSLDNGSSVVVRVNDRGPLPKNRVVDLSEAAARILGMIPAGTAQVELTAIPKEEALAWMGGPLDGQTAVGSPEEQGLPRQASSDSAAEPPDSTGTRVRIQVASYSSEANAKATVERLAASGLGAEIERAGDRFRVVFPDISPGESRILSQKLDGLGYRGFLITTTKPVPKL